MWKEAGLHEALERTLTTQGTADDFEAEIRNRVLTTTLWHIVQALISNETRFMFGYKNYIGNSLRLSA
jgi:hypothetical protein